ncbi:hypothetical protein LguiA_000072 [Lonicera macranthoides]
MKNFRHFLVEKPVFFAIAIAGLIGAFLLISIFMRSSGFNPVFCNLAGAGTGTQPATIADYSTMTTSQLYAILHYATSRMVPQQSLAEIKVSFEILRSSAPCNFLVFGLGHDSIMWDSFNPGGTTLFLEEDPKWVQTVLKDAPNLHAHAVAYRTKLSEADQLLKTYRSDPSCAAKNSFLRGNTRCKLALTGLPDEVYDKEWDLIMIDAPKGYFPEAPGRMGAIYSAAVMARNRKKSGVTHVFLHDVDRRVEKFYAEEFLCRRHMVKGVGRLWHFEIPPAANVTEGGNSDSGFC